MDKSEVEMFEYNPVAIEAVRKLINLDAPGRIEEALDLLEEWVNMQKHFVKKDFPRMYLETFLTTNKGMVELAKRTLDQLCTFKTLKPNYFPTSIKKETFAQIHEISIQAFLPKLTKDHYRVGLLQHISDNVSSTFFELFFQFCVMTGEYSKMHDYHAGYVLIIDYRNVNLFVIMAKTNIMELKQFYTVMSKGYGMRIKGIHILSSSKVLEPLMAVAKTIIGPKLVERLQVHQNIDTLYEAIDKDILPEEYGGKEKPLKTLSDKWLDVLCSKDQMEFFLEMLEAKTEEAYREADVFNENYIGMPGSFRALTVD